VNFRLPGVVKIFLSPGKQQEEYSYSSCCTSANVFVVSMKTGRVFKGSRAAFDKENADALAANPTVVEDQDY
jgi:hypothetical protein